MPLEDWRRLEVFRSGDSRYEPAPDAWMPEAARDCSLEVNRVMPGFPRLAGEPALTVKLWLKPYVQVAVTDTSSNPRGRAPRMEC